MENSDGKNVELYLPRKCSITNVIITPKDHGSVQINVAHTNDDGVYNGDYESFALVGWMRSKGNSDAALEFLAKREGLI